MRIVSRNSAILVLSVIVSVAGCSRDAGEPKDVEASGKIPEIGASLTSGPVLLNVGGSDYQLGDIVRIKTEVGEITKGDVILFDWRKATGEEGFGPTHMIGQVAGVPGEQLGMAAFLKYRGRDGKEKQAWFSTFQRLGAKNYDGNICLPAGNFLVETERTIMIIDRVSIGALVVEKLGHDDEAEKEMKQRVY